MKLLFCLGSLGKGGAERVISNLCNNFKDKIDIVVATTITSDKSYSIPENVQIFSLDENNKTNENFLKRNSKRIKKLENVIKIEKPDLIVSFLPEPSFRVLLLKNKYKIPTIVSVRNDPKVEYKGYLNKIVAKLLYPKADGFVFQTEEAQQYFSKKIQKKSVVIPNPINSDFLITPYDGIREKEIVTVGRLTEQKNQKLLIEAFSKINNEFPDYTLSIYGDGHLKEELQNHINELRLENKVFLKGIIDNVKEEIYKKALFVLSSDYEGMPNSLMEALALGIPSISTDCPCGGPRFLINDNKDGKLVPVKNVELLSKAMEEVLKDKELQQQFSINSSKKMKEQLDPNIICEKWFEYIMKIANRK